MNNTQKWNVEENISYIESAVAAAPPPPPLRAASSLFLKKLSTFGIWQWMTILISYILITINITHKVILCHLSVTTPRVKGVTPDLTWEWKLVTNMILRRVAMKTIETKVLMMMTRKTLTPPIARQQMMMMMMIMMMVSNIKEHTDPSKSSTRRRLITAVLRAITKSLTTIPENHLNGFQSFWIMPGFNYLYCAQKPRAWLQYHMIWWSLWWWWWRWWWEYRLWRIWYVPNLLDNDKCVEALVRLKGSTSGTGDDTCWWYCYDTQCCCWWWW